MCISLLNFILLIFLGTLLLTENLYYLYPFDPSRISMTILVIYCTRAPEARKRYE